MNKAYYKEQMECSRRISADLHKRLCDLYEEMRGLDRKNAALEKTVADIAKDGATLQIVYPKRDDRSSP